jgi:hypothetical protein
MITHAFAEVLTFTRCNNWNSDICPHLKDPHMQLSIINEPRFWLLDDQTVEELNGMCDQCEMFNRRDF